MSHKLVIPRSVYKEIMFYVRESDVEISGLGTCAYDQATKTFKVGRIVLCEQENGPTETNLSPASIAKAMHELRNEPDTLRFWWHSHVNMGVFWSGTDQIAMRELSEHGWFMATVFNKKAEMKSCASFPTTFGQMQLDDMATEIEDTVDDTQAATWRASMAERCKRVSFGGAMGKSPSVFQSSRHYHGYDDWNSQDLLPGIESGTKDADLLKKEKITTYKDKLYAEAEKKVGAMSADASVIALHKLENKQQVHGHLSMQEDAELEALQWLWGNGVRN